MTLSTPQLDLVLMTPGESLAWVDALPPEVRKEVSPVWIERVRNSQPGDYWALGYTILERATGHPVGSCAYKGPPDASGGVEIAYGVDEPHRGRGFATQAGEALTAFAFTQPGVSLVFANTLETNDASARTLTKCGFTRIGEVIDPEDGPVIRWERRIAT
jgi:[ribosomal protein S5]-alanine N-acetyltransferase